MMKRLATLLIDLEPLLQEFCTQKEVNRFS
jgi:hypothetical protein